MWEWRGCHDGILHPKVAAAIDSGGYLITTYNESLKEDISNTWENTIKQEVKVLLCKDNFKVRWLEN